MGSPKMIAQMGPTALKEFGTDPTTTKQAIWTKQKHDLGRPLISKTKPITIDTQGLNTQENGMHKQQNQKPYISGDGIVEVRAELGDLSSNQMTAFEHPGIGDPIQDDGQKSC